MIRTFPYCHPNTICISLFFAHSLYVFGNVTVSIFSYLNSRKFWLVFSLAEHLNLYWWFSTNFWNSLCSFNHSMASYWILIDVRFDLNFMLNFWVLKSILSSNILLSPFGTTKWTAPPKILSTPSNRKSHSTASMMKSYRTLSANAFEYFFQLIPSYDEILGKILFQNFLCN